MNSTFPSVALAACILLSGCGGSSEPTSKRALANAYKSEFGSVPPSSVASLQAKQVVVGDAGRGWLRFTADAATIASILSSGFETSSETEFVSETGGGNVPNWWHPNADQLVHFYKHPNWPKHMSQGRAYLAFDSERKIVYFMSSAWD